MSGFTDCGRAAALAVLGFAMLTTAVAQSLPAPDSLPVGRTKHHRWFPGGSGSASPWVSLESRASERGRATITVRHEAAEVVTELPFDDVGGALYVDDHRLLISGRAVTVAAPDGVFCRVRVNPDATADVLETSVVPGCDPYDIDWCRSRRLLAVIDVEQDVLRLAPFAGWPHDDAAVALPAADAFTIALHTPEFLAAQGTHPSIVADEVDGSFWCLGGPLGQYRCRVTAGIVGWRARYAGSGARPRWAIDTRGCWRTSGVADPVHVECRDDSLARPASFAIRSVRTGAIVGTGVVVADAPVAVSRPRALFETPGAAFMLAGENGIAASDVFRPLLRYGSPVDGTQLAFERGQVTSETLRVGGPEFVVGSRLGWRRPSDDAPASLPFRTQLWVRFGYRGPGAPDDPVAELGDRAVLLDPIPIDVVHDRIANRLGLGRAFRLPDAPDLEGVVMLFQLVSESTTHAEEVAASDVFGSVILPAPPAGDRLARQRQAVTALKRDAAWLQPDRDTIERAHRLRSRLIDRDR